VVRCPCRGRYFDAVRFPVRPVAGFRALGKAVAGSRAFWVDAAPLALLLGPCAVRVAAAAA